MAERRVLLVESPARISVSLGRLCLRREGRPDALVLPEDVAVLVLHHPAILLSAHVLRAMAEGGGMVLVTDSKHMPAGIMHPHIGQSVVVRRLQEQIALGDARRDEMWGKIVESRISTQAELLKRLGRNGALGLRRLRTKVVPGDPANVEAQAARQYWRNLLPEGARRVKLGAMDPLNIRLNFGYAVLRSLVARELAAAGLNAALGLGHHSRDNPFNLADDFMEPYRCEVDRVVVGGNFNTEFNGAARLATLEFLSAEVLLERRVFRLPLAVAETVASFTRVLASQRASLALPAL